MVPEKPRFIMCICTGECPGFKDLNLWKLVNFVRRELDVEYAIVHPQLCVEDGDRFWADLLQEGASDRIYIVGACAPEMQRKLFKDSLKNKNLDFDKNLIPLGSQKHANRRSHEEGRTICGTVKKDLGVVFMEIPRKEIPWFPTIDLEKCKGCLECVNFCRNGVFQVEGNISKPVVINLYNCIVGCNSCAKLCPNEAIMFPSRIELKKVLVRLREKYGY